MRKWSVILMILIGLCISLAGKMPVTVSAEKPTEKKLTVSGDRMYVLHRETRLVRILDTAGKEIKRFEILTPYSRALPDPVDIAFDNRVLYVLDAEFSEIWCYSPEGEFTHRLPPVLQYLQSPSAIYAKDNRLWIADTGCIWFTDELGNVLHRYALPKGPNGLPAVISDMTAGGNFLYALDTTGSRIFSIWIQTFSESANQSNFYGVEEGRFLLPSGITYNGNLYITDSLTGKLSVIHSVLGHSRHLSYPNQAISHPTDIQYWKDQLWMGVRDSENLIKVDSGINQASKKISLSVNLMDFGSLTGDYQASFVYHSVDGTPVSATLTSSHPAFQVIPGRIEKVTTGMPYVRVIASKLKPDVRETATITIKLDSGDIQKLEVRARKKPEKDFSVWVGSNDVITRQNNELLFQLLKQVELEGNLEFSIGSTLAPFSFSWKLPKMPFVNDKMENSVVVKPIGKPDSGFYTVPILVKCPEAKLLKQFSVTFCYKGMIDLVPGTMLGEYFAAEWCEYCPSGHSALPELHRQYSKEELVFLTYYNDCLKEMPERLCFPESEARMRWYASVGMHVTMILNGTTIKEGGYNDGVTTMTKEYNELIKSLSPMTSPVTLSGSARWDEANRELTVGAALQCLQDLNWKNPRLYCVLAEHGIEYDAQNGVKKHDYVVRDFIALPNPEKNEAYGSPIWGTDGELLSKADDQWQGHLETTVDPLVKMENAFCILFVQDNETKQVYQARYVPLHEEPERAMKWIAERKTVRLNLDQTANVKSWLVNRGNQVDRFMITIHNRKPFFGEDTWKVGGNEYSIQQTVSVTLNPMESVLVEFDLKPVWGKPEMPALDLKATDSSGNEAFCMMRIVGTELQPRYELLYPDKSILEEDTGWVTDQPNFCCVIRTEPGTVLLKESNISAGEDGIMVITVTRDGSCFMKYRRSLTLQYPDTSFESLTFFYEKTLVMKMTIGSKNIFINRNKVEYEAAPFIKNSRTMVPIRIITETLVCGSTIAWDATSHDITISMENMVIVIKEGKSYVLVNGKEVTLDAPPVNVNGRVFLPIRFFAEELGAKVDWDGKKQEVTITKKEAG